MKTFLLFGILWMTACRGLYAQDDAVPDSTTIDFEHRLVSPAELETTRRYLEDDLLVRKFNKEKWQKAVEGIDYTEEEEERAATAEMPSMPWAGPLLKVISYIVVAGAVLALLYFVLRAIPFRARIVRESVEVEYPGENVENIAALDTRSMLETAIREGNLKLAVRLYYLSLLKQLDAAGLITWKKDKTNRDYLGELFPRNFLFEDISRLTVLYESVWYGNRDVRPEMFGAMSANFEMVLEKVNESVKK